MNITCSMEHFEPIAIQVTDLSCHRGEHQVFEQLNFSLPNAAALLLRGPNGSGKSSLLMILAGLLPGDGTVHFERSPRSREQIPDRELIHYVGHLNAMKPELTLFDNLAFWAAMSGNGQPGRTIPDALENAGLGGLENFEAGRLSAGQKHRLSLARLLVTPRPVWLLDEPSSALDAAGDRWVAELIDAHIANNGLAVIATHRPISLNARTKAQTLSLGARAKEIVETPPAHPQAPSPHPSEKATP